MPVSAAEPDALSIWGSIQVACVEVRQRRSIEIVKTEVTHVGTERTLALPARTLAVRGVPASSASSPNVSPGFSVVSIVVAPVPSVTVTIGFPSTTM